MRRILHGSDNSHFVRIVRIVLFEKGLEFERNTLLSGERDPAEMAKLNPSLRVPILEEGERTLYDSRIIVDYLLATYPDTPPSSNAPPLATACTRPEQHWEDSLLLATLYTMLEAMGNLSQLKNSGLDAASVGPLKRHELRLEKSFDWLDERVTEEGFLPGWFSVQDIAALCAIEFVERRQIASWRGRKRLEAFYDTFRERPAVAFTRAK